MMRKGILLGLIPILLWLHAPVAEPPAARKHGSSIGELDCSNCHTTDNWKLDDVAAAQGGFDHAVTGFPLKGQHAATPCSGCHSSHGTKLEPDCENCHRDPHLQRLGDRCAECHTQTAWNETEVLARHRRSRMPLTGRHALIECAACHIKNQPMAVSSLPSDCYACHQSDYRRDIHPDHDGDPNDPTKSAIPRLCGRCHSTSAWSPAVAVPSQLTRTASLMRHDRVFVLSRGPHRTAVCNDCHNASTKARVVTCTGCHSRDRLVSQHRRKAVSLDASACLHCHPAGRAR